MTGQAHKAIGVRPRIKYEANPLIPPLSWQATLDFANRELAVIHGQYVETHNTFFVEGVWDGPFCQGGLDRVENVFGSGCTVRGETVVFVPSSATTDSLFYTATPSELMVSNSLPLLLARIGDSLDPKVPVYEDLNNSIMRGIDGYAEVIPTRRSSVRRLMYHNMEVGGVGPTRVEKPLPPHFSCYADYVSYLRSVYGRLIENARDQGRAKALKIYSTQSRGYDSTAVNVIAAPHGIDRVFTVTKSKGIGRYALEDENHQGNDDGTEICQILNVPSQPIDRRAFTKVFEDETLLNAGVHQSQDANLIEIRNYIEPPCILLTGTLGEMWYTSKCIPSNRKPLINDQLMRWDLSCHGMSELRLGYGFIQAPLPFIGARRRAEIHRITESAEMIPWRLDNNYDRPIPRRLGEEAGIPRSFFGQEKMASVVEVPQPQVPIGKELRRDFWEFLISNGLRTPLSLKAVPAVQAFNKAVIFAGPVGRYKLIYYLGRAVDRLSRGRHSLGLLWEDLNASFYVFCVNRVVEEYRRYLCQQT
jgi:hypothetical protein